MTNPFTSKSPEARDAELSDASGAGSDDTQGNAFLALAGIALATLLVYSPAFSAGFLNLDDYRYLTAVRSLNPARLVDLFGHPFEGYQPLSLLSLGLTSLLFGFDPWVHHAVSVAMHLANVFLVFLLLRCITGRERLALLATACFALLPAQVEPVVWVASRKDVQYAFFYLLGLRLYAQSVASPSRVRHTGVLVCFLLSALSKGMAVSFPLSMLAIDFILRRPWNRGRLLLGKLPFVAMAAFFGCVSVAAQRAGGYATGSVHLHEVPARLAGAAKALGLYLAHLVNPSALAAFHPWDGQRTLAWSAGLAIAAVWAGVAVFSLRRSRTLAFAGLFFLVNILLVLQFMPVAEFIVADRYLYVASIGFCLAVAALLDPLLDGGPLLRAARVSAGCLLVAMASAGFAYGRDWRDSITVWSRTVARYPNSAFALSMRAGALMERDAFREAIADLDRAAAAHPTYSRVYLNRGVARERMNDTHGAMADYATFSQLAPYDPQGYNNRGMLLLKAGHTVLAISNLTAAVMLGENHPSMHVFLGNRAEARLRAGDLAGAIEDADRAIAAFPRHYRAFLSKAEALYRMGDRAAAMQALGRARSIDPADPAAKDLLRRLAPE